MIAASFTDEEIAMVQRIAGNLPAEKRVQFLELTAAYMRQHGAYDDAVDVVELAVDLALGRAGSSKRETCRCTGLSRGFLAECLRDRCQGHQTRGNGVEFGL